MKRKSPSRRKNLQNKSTWLFNHLAFQESQILAAKHKRQEIYFHDKATETWLRFISSESKQTNEDIKYQSNVSSTDAKEASFFGCSLTGNERKLLFDGLKQWSLISSTVTQLKLDSVSIRELPLMQGGWDLPNPFLPISSMVFIH